MRMCVRTHVCVDINVQNRKVGQKEVTMLMKPAISTAPGISGTVKNGNKPRNFSNILPRGGPDDRRGGEKEEIE